MTRAAAVDAALSTDPVLLAVHDFTTLVTASARSARQRERILRAAGVTLTPASLSALRVVERYGPIVVSDVARRLDVDQSTASRQIRPLEEQSLVARASDGDDGRVSWLELTDAGQRVLDHVRDVFLNDFAVALDDWSSEDRTRLGELLERFRVDLLAARVDETGWSTHKESRSPRTKPTDTKEPHTA